LVGPSCIQPVRINDIPGSDVTPAFSRHSGPWPNDLRRLQNRHLSRRDVEQDTAGDEGDRWMPSVESPPVLLWPSVTG
jgi:hypothetical protein